MRWFRGIRQIGQKCKVDIGVVIAQKPDFQIINQACYLILIQKQTGNGHREGGWEVYEFYSETKVGYADFSGALQRAQIDNYLGTPD